MPDDKTVIETLRSTAIDFYNLGRSECELLDEAANRLEQLTQGDVVIVPREPTEEMKIAGSPEIGQRLGEGKRYAEACYHAMLSAAQKKDGVG